MVTRPRNYTFDAELALHMATAAVVGQDHLPAGGVAGTDAAPTAMVAGVGQVNGADKVIDLGSDTASYGGTVVIDVGAVAGQTTLLLQGSDTEDFSGDIVNLASIPLNVGGGHLGGANVDAIADRYESVFLNEQGDVIYQYVRLFKVGAGAIELNAFIGRANGGYMP